MPTKNTLTLTVTRHFAPLPSETQKELDRLCELYGKTLQRFQLTLCTIELRERIWGWRSFRNELVAALALPKEQFELQLKTLRAENKKNEAELLQYLRQRNTSEGDHLQARHWKLCLEEASRIQRTYWKSVTTKVRKQWGRFFGRYNDNPAAIAYVNWLLREEEPQFYAVVQGKIPSPEKPLPRYQGKENARQYQKRIACYEKLKTSIEGLSLFPVSKRVEQAISKIRKKT